MNAIWDKIRNEPLVIIAVIFAGINAATDQTWQGYLAAVIVALTRFIVYGPVTGKSSG